MLGTLKNSSRKPPCAHPPAADTVTSATFLVCLEAVEWTPHVNHIPLCIFQCVPVAESDLLKHRTTLPSPYLIPFITLNITECPVWSQFFPTISEVSTLCRSNQDPNKGYMLCLVGLFLKFLHVVEFSVPTPQLFFHAV